MKLRHGLYVPRLSQKSVIPASAVVIPVRVVVITVSVSVITVRGIVIQIGRVKLAKLLMLLDLNGSSLGSLVNIEFRKILRSILIPLAFRVLA